MVDHVLDINPVVVPPLNSAASPFTETTAQAEPEDKSLSAFEALKASFAAKVQFIESGISALGKEAEEELVALAEKYL